MLRIVLITRRFWPLVGGGEMVMSNLATEFTRQGHAARILTARWESNWPQEIVHRDVRVTRLPNPKRRGWGTLRYMLGVSRWLQQNRDNFDVVLVSMLKHDAYAAIGALRKTHSIPVVLRVEGTGETGDCRWHDQARFGNRIRQRCKSASAIVAPSPLAETELLEHFERDLVHFIPNGVTLPPQRSVERRWQARLALADINPDLASTRETPVALFTGRLHENKGLRQLVSAFRRVVDVLPQARLWLIGDGPLRDTLYQLTGDLDLRGNVMMPGAFDDIEDPLMAADVYVLPSYEEGMSLALLEGMAAQLPAVATDIPGNRAILEHGKTGWLVPVKKVQPLAETLTKLLQPTADVKAITDLARRQVVERYSISQTAAQFLQLFDQLRSSV